MEKGSTDGIRIVPTKMEDAYVLQVESDISHFSISHSKTSESDRLIHQRNVVK